MKKITFITFMLIASCYFYSQGLDTCSDITKKYDPFKEDSILQTKSEKFNNNLTYKFFLNVGKISLWFQFTTFTAEIIYEGELTHIYLKDGSIIKFKIDENSYPGVLGKRLTSHTFIFILTDDNLKKLSQIPITEIKISDYDFTNLTGQEKFMQNLNCISQYLK